MSGNLNLSEIATSVCSMAIKEGARQAEVFASETDGVSIQLHNGHLEWFRSLSTRGIGLRVFSENRMGFAYTSDLSPKGLRFVVTEALDNCRFNAPDEEYGLPTTTVDIPSIEGLYDPDFDEMTADKKIDLLRRVEEKALSEPMIKQMMAAHYGDEKTKICIANSNGFCTEYQTTLSWIRTEAIARENGNAFIGNGFDFARGASQLDPDKVGRKAAQSAKDLLYARDVKGGGNTRVLIDGEVMARLLTKMAKVLTGEAVQKGRSPFGELVGQKVGSDAVTLIDDPCLPFVPGSRPVDDEGVKSEKTILIEKGVLQGFLHNYQTSRKWGNRSTSNAKRTSYRSTPEVGTSNFFLVPGSDNEMDLRRKLGNGYHIVDVRGTHTISPITGRFSIRFSGFRLKGGEVIEPVTGGILAGNFLQLMKNIVAVGNEIRWVPERQVVGSPSVIVEDMFVGGK